MRKGLVIDTHADGYGFDQCDECEKTMTVGQLINHLSQYPSDIPVYVGNNRQGWYNGEPDWYTYGVITSDRLIERNEEDEEDEEVD